MSNPISTNVTETFSMSAQAHAHNKRSGIILLIVFGIFTLGLILPIPSVGLLNMAHLGGILLSLFLMYAGYSLLSDKKGKKLTIDSDGIQFIAANILTIKWLEIEHIEIKNIGQSLKRGVFIFPKNVTTTQVHVVDDYYERFDRITDLIRKYAEQNTINIKES